MPDSAAPSATLRPKEYALAALLLSLSVFLTHFLRFHEFGLYEDDFWSVAAQMGEPVSGLWSQAVYHFQHWHTGRPLNHLLPTVLGRVGFRLGGLESTYAIAAVWLSVNAFLAYLVARQILPLIPALVAALTYILFPADTTRILLLHAAHVQGAMTFLLLGLYLWLKRGWWRRLGYVVGGTALLSYESAFLPFVCAPLLLPATKEPNPRRVWLEHIGICGLIVALDALIRARTGDSRALAAAGKLGETVYRSVSSLVIGPRTSALSFLSATAFGYVKLDLWTMLLALLLLAAVAYMLFDLAKPARLDPAQTKGAIWIGGAAFITWMASYALTLTNYPPTQLVGRLTSTHLAAAWPVALLAGAISFWFLGQSRRVLATAGVAAGFLFTGLFSYHQFIQAEYVRAWQIEKRFWSQVVESAPDVNGSTIIVTGSPDPAMSSVIASNSWADGVAAQRIFGASTHFAHLGILGSLVEFRRNRDQIEWRPEFWGDPDFLKIDPSNLILFESVQGSLRRVESVVVSTGPLHSTRPIPPVRRGVWPESVVSRIFQR